MAYQYAFEDPSVFRARRGAEDREAYDAKNEQQMIDDWIARNPTDWQSLRRAGTLTGGYSDPNIARSYAKIRAEQEIQKIKSERMPGQLAEMYRSQVDPYSAERDQVIRDPSGALNNSPFFKFMQEKYMNNATAKNAAGGFRNSGRGLMALGEAGQKASADYLFPYLQALGRPQSGANAFFEAYKFMNTPQGGGGGGFRQPAAPRQSLSMVGAPAPASALPSGGGSVPSFSGADQQWLDWYNSTPDKNLRAMGPNYVPSSAAGSGGWMNDQTGAGGVFYPKPDPNIDMGV